MALTGTIQDNFDDNSKNTGVWEEPYTVPGFASSYSTVAGTVSETGGQLSLTGAVSSGTPASNGYVTVDETLDLRGSEIVIQVPTVPTGSGQSIGIIFGASVGSSERIRWGIYNSLGTVEISATINNFGNQGTAYTATYNATDHAWLRIRQDSAGGGTIYWDTAPNSGGSPGTWVNRRTVVTGAAEYWSPASVQIGVAVVIDSNSASPYTFVVDNFNTTSSVVPAISSVSDATIEPGQTGVVITGTGFSASGNTVKISPTNNVADGAAVTQTITAQSATSITITGVKGGLSFETGLYLFVTNASAVSNATGYSVQFVARPFVRETLISETGAAVASETGMTMVVYHSVPTTGSPNPAQVIGSVSSNGSGAIDVQLARGALALNAPVWIALMKDGSPAKGTLRKVTPVYE